MKRYEIIGTLNEEVQQLVDKAGGDLFIDEDGYLIDPEPNGWLEDRLEGLIEVNVT